MPGGGAAEASSTKNKRKVSISCSSEDDCKQVKPNFKNKTRKLSCGRNEDENGTEMDDYTRLYYNQDQINEIIGSQEFNSERKDNYNANMKHTQHPSTSSDKTNSQTSSSNITFNSPNKIKPISLYTDADQAPFFVFMDKPNLNEFDVAKLLSKAKIEGIIEIRKLNRNRIRVQTKSKISANAILQHAPLRSLQQINCFIPNQYVKSIGIVRGVSTDLSNDEISEFMESSVPIESFERLNYWDKENRVSKPGTTLKIVFRTTNLPQEIKIFYVVKKVTHFIPAPIICRNCLRYGHTAKICKSMNESRCNNCTEKIHSFINNDCNKSCVHCTNSCVVKCMHCKESNNHKTSSRECPVMKHQTIIKEKMVKEKLSYQEAKQQLGNSTTPNLTYANATQLVNLNNLLVERLKNTEDVLREILSISHEDTDANNSPNKMTSTFKYIIRNISKHCSKYKINLGNTSSVESDGDEIEL